MTDTVSSKELSGKSYAKFIRPAVVIVLLSLIIEIFVFNFRSVQSLFYKEISVPVEGHTMTGMKYFGDGLFKFTRDDVRGVNVLETGQKQSELEYDTGEGVDGDGNAVHALYLAHLDKLTDDDIHNIKLDIETPDAIDVSFGLSGVLYVQTHIKDEGNAFYEHLTPHPVLQTNEASKYIFMQTSGKVSAIVTEFNLSNGVLLRIKSITLNAHRPVVFSFYRFFIIMFLCIAVYALRPASVFWKFEAGVKASWKKYVLVVMCIIFIMPAWILIRENAYLTYFVEFNPYQDLAEALSERHFYLNVEPDPNLADLSNPYDDSLRMAEGIDTKWDFAYYNGRYYVYFGIVPCLIFYLPIYLILGTHMPNSLPVLFSAVFLFIGIYELIKVISIVFYPKFKYAALLILTTVTYFGCQIPFFLNQPDGYAVPVACAEALLVWALYFWISSLNDAGWKRYVRVAMGSLLMALIAGTRPTMELYALLAVPIFAGVVRGKSDDDKKNTLKFAAAFIIPFIPIAAGLMYYNAARFGSVFDFGNNYNLTVSDVSLNPFSFDKLWIGIYEYLLKLPDLAYSFPFVSIPGDGTSENVLGHCFIHMEYIFAGLLPVNLILFSLFSLWGSHGNGGCLKNILTDRMSRLRLFGIMTIILGLFMLIFISESAGIVYRYEADFSLILLIGASTAVMLLAKRADEMPGEGGILYRRMIMTYLLISLVWTLAYHVNFYFLTGLKYPLLWGNTELYYRIFHAFNFFG